MKYISTINHDLQGISKLLLFNNHSNFSSVAVYSIFRDSCVMLYEIVKVLKKDGILREEVPNFEIIESIRHKVKSNQGRDNREIFNNILTTHFNLFGEDIDNLGFYLEEGRTSGSTIYITYIFDNTPLFNSIDTGQVIKEFSTEIGRMIAQVMKSIQQPLVLTSKNIIADVYESGYELKDIWHKKLFTEDITFNVCLMRLLIIQNEISSCLWLEKHLDYKTAEYTLDKYLLLRLSSIKFYQTMENLIDIKERVPQHYSSLGLNCLDSILLYYKNELRDEIKTLRDMLHYSNHQINFFEYVTDNLVKDNMYVDNILQILLIDFFPKIKESISNSLNISSIRSMNDWEKIIRRIDTKIKSRNNPK